MEVRLPRLSEGAESATVVKILVKEGDQVEEGQGLLEVEVEKAVASIPAPASGIVTKIHVAEGEEVTTGQLLISLSEGGASRQPKPAEAKEPTKKPPAKPAQEAAAPVQYVSTAGFPPPASPAIRELAARLGIDLTRVRGSERGGRIVMSDLRRYVENLQQVVFGQEKETAEKPLLAPWAKRPAAEKLDFLKWGPTTRKRVSSLRRTIAERMAESWATIPHVTQCDDADITELMALRKKNIPRYEAQGARLTLTSFVLVAVVEALRKLPIFNASLDEMRGEIVYKDYYHIGVAVDTEHGLIVPTLRDVDKKSMLELSLELQDLAERTRNRQVSVEELHGGSFTVSNLGGVGGTYFSPIINKPQAAVLGVGRAVARPQLRGKTLENRLMLPLSVSYDHRLIDGADGARFIRLVAESLENFPEDRL